VKPSSFSEIERYLRNRSAHCTLFTLSRSTGARSRSYLARSRLHPGQLIVTESALHSLTSSTGHVFIVRLNDDSIPAGVGPDDVLGEK